MMITYDAHIMKPVRVKTYEEGFKECLEEGAETIGAFMNEGFQKDMYGIPG